MRFRFHPEARAELRAAIDDYDGGAAAGGRFLAVVTDVIRRALETPHAGPLWPGMPSDLHVRRRNIPGFKYRSLAYAIIDDLIWIVAVVHERKPPGYWRDRVRDLPDL